MLFSFILHIGLYAVIIKPRILFITVGG